MKTLFQNIFSEVIGKNVNVQSFQSLSGGCIHQAYSVRTNQGAFFIKLNEKNKLDMFQKEEHSLDALRSNSGLIIPQVVTVGQFENYAYFISEFIERGQASKKYFEHLGTGLAELHQVSNKNYGWKEDNYIGELVQKNKETELWLDFFFEQRLQPQFELAIRNQLISSSYLGQLERLKLKLEDYFPKEKSSLLHGDLWYGNTLASLDEKAALIDPAVYYGHREIELSFMKLFGGFDASCFEAYHEVYPLESNWEDRMSIYNMYALMVHTNLFGKHYFEEVKQTLSLFA
ncbi:fructosamine kinase family protein [Sediminitomix flava]|nr:fructosamine kinase family protein [Sediminitomix flava]